MSEPYVLIERESSLVRTMPEPSRSNRSVLLHAAVDGENGEITVACPYPVVPDRDLAKRETRFSGNIASIVHQVPKCPACVAAVETDRPTR